MSLLLLFNKAAAGGGGGTTFQKSLAFFQAVRFAKIASVGRSIIVVFNNTFAKTASVSKIIIATNPVVLSLVRGFQKTFQFTDPLTAALSSKIGKIISVVTSSRVVLASIKTINRAFSVVSPSLFSSIRSVTKLLLFTQSVGISFVRSARKIIPIISNSTLGIASLKAINRLLSLVQSSVLNRAIQKAFGRTFTVSVGMLASLRRGIKKINIINFAEAISYNKRLSKIVSFTNSQAISIVKIIRKIIRIVFASTINRFTSKALNKLLNIIQSSRVTLSAIKPVLRQFSFTSPQSFTWRINLGKFFKVGISYVISYRRVFVKNIIVPISWLANFDVVKFFKRAIIVPMTHRIALPIVRKIALRMISGQHFVGFYNRMRSTFFGLYANVKKKLPAIRANALWNQVIFTKKINKKNRKF
jgi:hypothetical protein